MDAEHARRKRGRMGKVVNVYMSDDVAEKFHQLVLAGFVDGASELFARAIVAGVEEQRREAERKYLKTCGLCGSQYAPALSRCPDCHRTGMRK